MCGVFGAYGIPDLFNNSFQGAYKQQGRGQDAAGCVFSDGVRFIEPAPHKTEGTIEGCMSSWKKINEEKLKRAPLLIGVVHNYYQTSGERLQNRTNIGNAQPFVFYTKYGRLAIAHNGDTPNYEEERTLLRRKGTAFASTSDTEVLFQKIARCNAPTLVEGIVEVLSSARSAYALIIATPDKLIVCRDPWGIRPLSMGKLEEGYVFASETAAFKPIGAQFIRDIEAGELVWIESCETNRPELHEGIRITPTFAREESVPLRRCSFENTYFSRPSSNTFGRPVAEHRRKLGAQLAKEYGKPTFPDPIIVPITDSGIYAAEGYAHAVGIPTTQALERDHHVGRTFIAPGQKNRERQVRLKHEVIEHLVKGKDCMLVDDSIVRGTTIFEIVKLIREAGARSITVLIACPMIVSMCPYGIDFKTNTELAAHKAGGEMEKIRQMIGADILYYLTLKGYKEVFGDYENFCFGCLDRAYPFF